MWKNPLVVLPVLALLVIGIAATTVIVPMAFTQPPTAKPKPLVGGNWFDTCTSGRVLLEFEAHPAAEIKDVQITATWPSRQNLPGGKPGAWKVIKTFEEPSASQREINYYRYVWDISTEPDEDRPPPGATITITFNVHAKTPGGSNDAPNGPKRYRYIPSGCSVVPVE